MNKLIRSYKCSFFILIGMLLYSMSDCILSAFSLRQYYEYIRVLSFFFIIFSYIIYRPKVKLLYHQSYMNVFLLIYICLYILAIARGFDLRQRSSDISTRRWLIQIITDKYYMLWGILPIIAMTVSRTFNFSRLIPIIEILCLFSIASIGLNLNKIGSLPNSIYFQRDGNLSSVTFVYIFDAVAFFLVGLSYIKDKTFHFIIIITFIVTFLVRLYLARRGDVVMLSLLAVFVILSYRYRQSKTVRILLIASFFIIIMFFLVLIFQTDIPSMILHRWTEDSRSGVNEALLSSMSTPELFLGKGNNGSYYLPHIGSDIYDGQRYICETGFLTLVLKGGILMATVYILLWLVPAFMGLFKSKNTFCKFAGLYLLWNVLYMYPFGNPEFSFNQLLVWILAGIVSSPIIRRLSDKQIKTIYF